MNFMTIHPSSRFTCPWHQMWPRLLNTLTLPLTYMRTKCSSQAGTWD